MKHVLFCMGILLLCSPLISSAQVNDPVNADPRLNIKLKNQPRFYFNIHGGYSIALGSTFKFYPDDVSSVSVRVIENNSPATSTTYQATTRGLGEGWRVGAGLSYVLNDFINVGIDFSYLSTSISRNRDSSFYQLNTAIGMDYNYKQQYRISYKATLITINPNITFKAISRPRFFIYNKIGPVLTFRPNSIQAERNDEKIRAGWQGFYKDSSAVSSRRYEWGIRNPALGFMGGIGTQFRITERVRAYAEAQFTHIVFVTKNRVLTNYDVNGKELVNTLSMSQKEIVFEREFTDNGQDANPNKPTVASRQRFPVSYVGFQAGLSYRF